jgi:hypothetical protein
MPEDRVSNNQQHGQAQQELHYDEFSSCQAQGRSKYRDKDSFAEAAGDQKLANSRQINDAQLVPGQIQGSRWSQTSQEQHAYSPE